MKIQSEKAVKYLQLKEELQGVEIAVWLDTLEKLSATARKAEEDFASAIARYEQAGWLTYHGYQKDVRPFIEKAHCFVLPSYHEGMANTNLESASMGRPVITTNIHGCKEAVLEHISGFLCEPQNSDSLYEAMKRFMDLPNKTRTAMGLAGRSHMEAVFDKKKVIAATMQALNL